MLFSYLYHLRVEFVFPDVKRKFTSVTHWCLLIGFESRPRRHFRWEKDTHFSHKLRPFDDALWCMGGHDYIWNFASFVEFSRSPNQPGALFAVEWDFLRSRISFSDAFSPVIVARVLPGHFQCQAGPLTQFVLRRFSSARMKIFFGISYTVNIRLICSNNASFHSKLNGKRINPRPPGERIHHHRFFLNNVLRVTGIDAKLDILFRTSILRTLTKLCKLFLKTFWIIPI